MDLEEIKKISCTDYICSLGISKDRKSNSNFSFFKSPFRDENTASLGVNERKNTWFDYGAGFGGDEKIGFNHPAIKEGSGYQKVFIESRKESDYRLCWHCHRDFVKMVGDFLKNDC